MLPDQLNQIGKTEFRDQQPVFQDNNAPFYTCGIAWDWFYEHDDELEHLMWYQQPHEIPAVHDLNIIGIFSSVFENKWHSLFDTLKIFSELRIFCNLSGNLTL